MPLHEHRDRRVDRLACRRPRAFVIDCGMTTLWFLLASHQIRLKIRMHLADVMKQPSEPRKVASTEGFSKNRRKLTYCAEMLTQIVALP